MQSRLRGLCLHLQLHPFSCWGPGTPTAISHGEGSQKSLLTSLPCHPAFTYRHSSYVMKTEPSQRNHIALLCPQPLEEPFLTQSRPSQGWQSHRQSSPMVLLPSRLFRSPSLYCCHTVLLVLSPRHCGTTAFALSVPSLKCSLPQMTTGTANPATEDPQLGASNRNLLGSLGLGPHVQVGPFIHSNHANKICYDSLGQTAMPPSASQHS